MDRRRLLYTGLTAGVAAGVTCVATSFYYFHMASSTALAAYREAVSYVWQANIEIDKSTPTYMIALTVEKGSGYMNDAAQQLDSIGVHHLAGIAAKLDQTAVELTAPDTTSVTKKADYAFIKKSFALLNAPINDFSLNVRTVNAEIDKVYNLMSPAERQNLY